MIYLILENITFFSYSCLSIFTWWKVILHCLRNKCCEFCVSDNVYFQRFYLSFLRNVTKPTFLFKILTLKMLNFSLGPPWSSLINQLKNFVTRVYTNPCIWPYVLEFSKIQCIFEKKSVFSDTGFSSVASCIP